MSRFEFLIIVVLTVLVYLGAPMLMQAQDVDGTGVPFATNTPVVEVTLIPTPDASPESGAGGETTISPVEVTYDLSTILTGLIAAFLGGSILTGATIGVVLLSVVRSFNAVQKQALNHLFMSLPPGLQGDVRQTLKDVDEVVEFGKEVTGTA